MQFSSPEVKPSNHSGAAIVISNVFAISLAMIQDWDLRPMLIIYWSQSVIIGVFNFLRMIRLKSFSTEGFTSNGNPVPETTKGKWSTAIFFAVHYGFFHLGYLVFVLVFVFGDVKGIGEKGAWTPGGLEGFLILSAILGFLAGHWFSYRQNVEADLARKPNIGTMMFLPYARIIPMHLTIILGAMLGSNRLAVLLFSVLKTGADYLMHVVEHRVLQKKPDKTE